MHGASRQDQSPWRVLPSKVGLVFIVTFFCVLLSHSSAQIQDTTPPILIAFSFTPTTINTSSGSTVVTANFSVTDDRAGVLQVGVSFVSPSGTYVYGNSQSFSPPVTSGSGVVNVTFPQFSEIGTWTVLNVGVKDNVGNFKEYQTTELAQNNFPTDLEVVGDTTPPVITVSATPKTLSPPNGKMVSVTLSGAIKDAESGVKTSTALYAVTDEYGLIQPSGPVPIGSDGSYSFNIQLQASRKDTDRDGRKYTITISAQNNDGHQGSNSTIVTVPHDQR
jgi:hypothetical protein